MTPTQMIDLIRSLKHPETVTLYTRANNSDNAGLALLAEIADENHGYVYTREQSPYTLADVLVTMVQEADSNSMGAPGNRTEADIILAWFESELTLIHPLHSR